MSAEDRGCCRHCIDGCEGGSEVWMHTAQEQPAGETTPTAYAVWEDGGCPMCAEAARIATTIEAQFSGSLRDEYGQGKDAGIALAARIAHGLRVAPEQCESCGSDDIDVDFHGYRCRECGGPSTLLPPRHGGDA